MRFILRLSIIWTYFFEIAIIRLLNFGSLAQLVEQRTLNPRVAGSIPARPTIFKNS
jgi:hypothetical protein